MPRPIVSKMVHRAVVQRDTATGTGAWNTPPAPTWAAHLAAAKCFAWSVAGREVVDNTKTVVVEDIKAIFPLGTDLTEKDRITNITDRQSVVLFAGPMGVEKIQRHVSHLEASLVKLSE